MVYYVFFIKLENRKMVENVSPMAYVICGAKPKVTDNKKVSLAHH